MCKQLIDFTTTPTAFHKLSHLHEPDTDTGEPNIYSSFDSEDDYH